MTDRRTITIELSVEDMGTISIALDQYVARADNLPAPYQRDIQLRWDRIYKAAHTLFQDRVVSLTRGNQ